MKASELQPRRHGGTRLLKSTKELHLNQFDFITLSRIYETVYEAQQAWKDNLGRKELNKGGWYKVGALRRTWLRNTSWNAPHLAQPVSSLLKAYPSQSRCGGQMLTWKYRNYWQYFGIWQYNSRFADPNIQNMGWCKLLDHKKSSFKVKYTWAVEILEEEEPNNKEVDHHK